MGTNKIDVLPDKFHSICRSSRAKVPWLLPSKKISKAEMKFQDEIRSDMIRFSDETLSLIVSSDRDPRWLRSVATAEITLRSNGY